MFLQYKTILSLVWVLLCAPALVQATDLAITKEVSPSQVNVGDQVTFTLTVDNTSTFGGGPLDSPNTRTYDNMSSMFIIQSAVPSQGPCSVGANNRIDCNLGMLPKGSTATITITAVATVGGQYTNTAYVSGDLFDPNPENNNDSSEVTVLENNADVEVIKTVDKTKARSGDDLTYTITVKNNGGQTAEGVTLTDDLPMFTNNIGLRRPGTGFVSVDPADDCSLAGQRITCDFGELAAGESRTVTIVVYAQVDALLSNYAEVTSSEPEDPNLSNNFSDATTDTRRVYSNGGTPEAGDAGDPVSSFTGELFFYDPNDLDLGGPMPLSFGRYYAGFLERDGIVAQSLGPNWTHNFEFYLDVQGVSAAVVTPAGEEITFRNIGGTWKRIQPDYCDYQLVPGDGDTFRFGDPEARQIFTFDDQGRLIQITQGQNTHTLDYTEGQLAQVSDGLGRTLGFSYDANGKLEMVTDGTRTISFGYTQGVLTSVDDVLGATTTYTYDTDNPFTGLLKSRTRPKGNNWYTHTYDDQGRVVTQIDAMGNTTSFAYDGLTTTITDPYDNVRSSVHDEKGHLLRITDPLGQQIGITYEVNGKRTGINNLTGGEVQRVFDSQTNLPTEASLPGGESQSVAYKAIEFDGISFYMPETITYPDGLTEEYTYDNVGNPVTRRDRAGYIWEYSYNARHQLLEMTDPQGAATIFNYNDDGTLASCQDAVGNLTRFSYDGLKRRTGTLFADGTTRTVMLDAADRILSEVDEAGQTTTYVYDLNGNITSVTTPSGAVTGFAYDAMDRFETLIDPVGATVVITYDGNGNIDSWADPNGQVITFTYDEAGRLASRTTPGGDTWDVSLDANGNLTGISNPLSATRQLVLDTNGTPIQETDPLGNTTTIITDSMGRRTETLDSSGLSCLFDYAPQGTITGITLPGGIGAAFEVNPLGQVDKVIDPAGNHWTRTYDLKGRLTSLSDPLGGEYRFSYDPRDRVTHIDTPAGTIDRTYDALGRVTAEIYDDGTTFNLAYDTAGRLLQADGLMLGYDARGAVMGSNGLSFTRDAGGRLTGITWPDGQNISYSYNERGLLDEVQDGTGGITSFTYDDAWRLININRANGVTTTFTYNAAGFITGIEDAKDEVLAAHSLTRDGRGNVTGADRELPLSLSFKEETGSLSFDAANQVTSFTYDALGNRLSDGTRSYTWNDAARLTGVTQGTHNVTFSYDALGRLLTRTIDGDTCAYNWNYGFDRPGIASITHNDNLKHYYVHTPDGHLLYRIAADGSRQFYHFDEVGHTTLLTGDDGAVLAAYAYAPYGEPLGEEGTVEDNPFTYVGVFGVLAEPELGLYQMGRRFYDSRTGRFISRDPVRDHVDPQAINPYTYAAQNPLRFIDPLGAAPQDTAAQNQGSDLGFFETSASTISFAGFWTEAIVTGGGLFGNSGITGMIDDLKGRTPKGGLEKAFRNSAVTEARNGARFQRVGNTTGARQSFLRAKDLAMQADDLSGGSKWASRAGNGATALSAGFAMNEARGRINRVEDDVVRQHNNAADSFRNATDNLIRSLKRGAISRREFDRRFRQLMKQYEDQIDAANSGLYIDLGIEGTRGLIKGLEAFVPQPPGISIGDGFMELGGWIFGTRPPK